jgi:hypothetical protein
MSITVVSRNVLFNGQVQELPEDSCKFIETIMKETGETMEQALERMYAEFGDHEVQRMTNKHYSPNTMDYYLTVT